MAKKASPAGKKTGKAARGKYVVQNANKKFGPKGVGFTSVGGGGG